MPIPDSSMQPPPDVADLSSQNLIVVNKEGLDEDALRRVLAPFVNARQVSGVAVAAGDESDDEFDNLAGAMARSAVRGG